MRALGPALATLLMVGVLLSGCSANKYPAPPQDETGAYLVKLTADNKFSPAQGTIPAGAKIRFLDEGGNHDVSVYQGTETYITSSKELPPAGVGNRELAPGESWTTTLNQTGTYVLWCHMHHEFQMKMDLQVA